VAPACCLLDVLLAPRSGISCWVFPMGCLLLQAAALGQARLLLSPDAFVEMSIVDATSGGEAAGTACTAAEGHTGTCCMHASADCWCQMPGW